MKVIIVSESTAHWKLIDAPAIPKVGDLVDIFTHRPKVIGILWYPTNKTIVEEYKIDGIFGNPQIIALIGVE